MNRNVLISCLSKSRFSEGQVVSSDNSRLQLVSLHIEIEIFLKEIDIYSDNM